MVLRISANPYFNPRAPCGARLPTPFAAVLPYQFQSTRPVRGATFRLFHFFQVFQFQSTRPVRGATGITSGFTDCGKFQSTRPVRGATGNLAKILLAEQFQSTRPVRGATVLRRPRVLSASYFNPRAPCGARQQKYTKLLYTLLRQKAILRQFHAKRRLLKRFSTYKYRNTFLICSANRMGKICTLPLRTTRSLDLPEGMSACSQSARFCFRTFFPSSKTADYPALDP